MSAGLLEPASPEAIEWIMDGDDSRSQQQQQQGNQGDASHHAAPRCDTSWLHYLGGEVWHDKMRRQNLAPIEASLLALALYRSDVIPPIALAINSAVLLSRPKGEVQLLRLAESPKVGNHLCYKVGLYQPKEVIHRSPALLLTRCPCPHDHQIQHEVTRPLPDRAAAVAYGANLQMLDAIWKSAEGSGDPDTLMDVASDSLCGAIAGCHAEIVQWVLGKIISSQALFPTLSSPCSTDFIFRIFATNIPYSIAAHRRWHLGLRLLQEAGTPATVPPGVSSPIGIAARVGDVKILERLIALGFGVKDAYFFFRTYNWKNDPSTCDPLIASLKNPALTKILLKAGADPHQPCDYLLSPFEYCTGRLEEKSIYRRLIPRMASQNTFLESAVRMVISAGKKTKYRKSERVRDYEDECFTDDWTDDGYWGSSPQHDKEEPLPEYLDSRQADLHERRLNRGRHRKLKE